MEIVGNKEQSPVRETEVRCGTRKSTTACAFPGGGRFAWLAGTATPGREPDHLVFLAEDKSVHSRQPTRAKSTQVLARAVLGVARWLGDRGEIVFVLITERGPGGGIELKSEPSSNERQQIKREIQHGSSRATAVPYGNSLRPAVPADDIQTGIPTPEEAAAASGCPVLVNLAHFRDSRPPGRQKGHLSRSRINSWVR